MASALARETDSNRERASTSSVRGPATFWPIVFAIMVAVLAVVIGIAVFVAMWGRDSGPPAASLTIPPPYRADRAEAYLRQICDFGPRPSGSAAMLQQQEFLENYFTKAGAEVEMQAFKQRDPNTGAGIEMVNIIARFNPDAKQRYLLCAHYDTRPFPDRDPVNPRGVFVGANDGASGVAALMELAHHVDSLPPSIGVDMVMFDGEELVYQERRDSYFLGSTYFAQNYINSQPKKPYIAGVLLDMVGDRELRIYYERNSWNYARDVCKSVFETAEMLEVDAFVPRVRHDIRDDHLPLNEIAKIPTIDIIDFDYPRPGIGAPQYWHTTQDTPENCSGHSIATVVYVIHQWLMRL